MLSNAIKYSDAKGLVEISLQNGVLSIKDRGIGISKEEQSNILNATSDLTKIEVALALG